MKTTQTRKSNQLPGQMGSQVAKFLSEKLEEPNLLSQNPIPPPSILDP